MTQAISNTSLIQKASRTSAAGKNQGHATASIPPQPSMYAAEGVFGAVLWELLRALLMYDAWEQPEGAALLRALALRFRQKGGALRVFLTRAGTRWTLAQQAGASAVCTGRTDVSADEPFRGRFWTPCPRPSAPPQGRSLAARARRRS